ncbi:MAG: hypothetical protein LBJ15_16330 [Comamonas sp.]|jgi:hypothetical protein|uniref:hypothetical protein n=1 Tax=Comamonas sp. TaxID=34028 RepID=UPI00282708B3|nr:hypothetical protein [Comamonas sp.]MDR0215550.1 hypothetical protein [Comamonas sp.]
MQQPIAEIYGSTWEQQRDEIKAKQDALASQQREALARDTAQQQLALREGAQSAPQMPQIPSGLMNMVGSGSGSASAGSATGAPAGATAGGSSGGLGSALASAGPWAALAAAVVANETSARNGGHRRNGAEYLGDLLSGDVAYQDAGRVEKATGSKAVGSLWKAATAANPQRILKALF